jgi:Uri superfamily endonuclease
VDYLRAHARVGRAWIWSAASITECELAQRLEAAADRTPRGFGASDCRCAGHLLRVHPDATDADTPLPAQLGGTAWERWERP